MSSSARMPHYRVTVMGDGGVGKTALTIQLCLNHFVETYDPTIEDSNRKQVHVGGVLSLLEILDTAGQEEYSALRDQWIRDGDAFLLVYSIAARNTFERIQKAVDYIRRVKELAPSDLPIVIVGNKADRASEREVSTVEGETLAKNIGCGFIESSAKTGTNVEEAFYQVLEMTRCKREGKPMVDAVGSMQQSIPVEHVQEPMSDDDDDGGRNNTSRNPSDKRQRRKKKCIVM